MSLVFFSLAALFNSLMDILEYSAIFNKSRLKNLNAKWWCKDFSWKYVKFLPYTKYRPDGWHISKSLMVIFMVLSAITYKSLFGWWDFLIYGAVWNGVFNLFYNKIWR